MSFYRTQELGHSVLAQYIVDNEDRTLIGYLLKALYLGEIDDADFNEFYTKLCTDDKDSPMSLLRAKQYVALVNRVKCYEETGKDVIPEDV